MLILRPRQPIGFHNNNPKQKEEKPKADESLIVSLIRQKYAPTGDTEQKVFLTTIDLALEFEDMTVTRENKAIAEALHAGGYDIKNIDGKIYWVLYEIDQKL